MGASRKRRKIHQRVVLTSTTARSNSATAGTCAMAPCGAWGMAPLKNSLTWFGPNRRPRVRIAWGTPVYRVGEAAPRIKNPTGLEPAKWYSGTATPDCITSARSVVFRGTSRSRSAALVHVPVALYQRVVLTSTTARSNSATAGTCAMAPCGAWGMAPLKNSLTCPTQPRQR